MEENKKIIIVGIPGVGKTTLVTKLVEILKSNNKTVIVVSFGTVMLDEAKKKGFTDRDQLRKLTINEQRDLQKMASNTIANLSKSYIIIDTHTFISTPSGYHPGLPDHVLKYLKPTNFISVYAKPEDIYNRRMRDATRSRDKISIDGIKKELSYHESMLSACSIISGSPIKPILNSEGKIQEAVDKIINAIGL